MCLGGLPGPVLQPPPSAGSAAHLLGARVLCILHSVHVPWVYSLSACSGVLTSVVDTWIVPRRLLLAKDAAADSHIQASSELQFSVLLGYIPGHEVTGARAQIVALKSH